MWACVAGSHAGISEHVMLAIRPYSISNMLFGGIQHTKKIGDKKIRYSIGPILPIWGQKCTYFQYHQTQKSTYLLRETHFGLSRGIL